jgi:hypothetical protein
MKTKSNRLKAKINWAAKVRKYKPQMNGLTNVERRRLLKEALTDINGANAAAPHVRRS